VHIAQNQTLPLLNKKVCYRRAADCTTIWNSPAAR